jgi:hypothetical protein
MFIKQITVSITVKMQLNKVVIQGLLLKNEKLSNFSS